MTTGIHARAHTNQRNQAHTHSLCNAHPFNPVVPPHPRTHQVATASIPALLRLGSGGLVLGYNVSLAEDDGK